MLLPGKRPSRGSGSSTVQQTDADREAFVSVSEAVLEHARAVARRIAERVRLLAVETPQSGTDPAEEQSLPRDPRGPDGGE
jgi:hypothetical protein